MEAVELKSMLMLLLLAPSLLVLASPCSAKEQTFYLKADLGISLPYLENLENELARQGTKLDPGYGFSAALGRRVEIELQFSIIRFPLEM